MCRFVTIQQASELCGLSVTTIRRRVTQGTLPALRVNTSMGKLLFDPDQLMGVLRKESISNLRDHRTKDDRKPKYTCTEAHKGFEEDRTGIHTEPAPAVPEITYLAGLLKQSNASVEAAAPTANTISSEGTISTQYTGR